MTDVLHYPYGRIRVYGLIITERNRSRVRLYGGAAPQEHFHCF